MRATALACVRHFAATARECGVRSQTYSIRQRSLGVWRSPPALMELNKRSLLSPHPQAWRHTVGTWPRPRSRVFWQAVPVHASGMVHSADPDDVSRHYGALMKHVATFATRNTLAVIAGLLPVVALFLMSNVLYDHDRRTPIVEVRPATAVLDITASVPVVRNRDGGLLIDRRKIPAQELRLLGETLGDGLMLAPAEAGILLPERLSLPWLRGDAFRDTSAGGCATAERNARNRLAVRPRSVSAAHPLLALWRRPGTGGPWSALIAGGIAAGWRCVGEEEALAS